MECLEVADYLESIGIKKSYEEICNIIDLFFKKNEEVGFNKIYSKIATIDYFLGRDVKKDIKKLYYIESFLELVSEIPLRALTVGELMSFINCNKLLKSINYFQRLFLGDLGKDYTFESKKRFTLGIRDLGLGGPSIKIESKKSKEFTFALASKLHLLSPCVEIENGIILDTGFTNIDTILAYLDCGGNLKNEKNCNERWSSKIEINDKNDVILVFVDGKVMGNYKIKKKGEYIVMVRKS